MAITSERLIQSAQLEPADLGASIIDPKLSPEEQQAKMVAWVEENVLDLALGEVETPLQEASGYTTIEAFIEGRFPDLSTSERFAAIQAGDRMFDGAHLAYSRSELNKTIDSNDESHDRDANEDRITADKRLAKLLAWVAKMIATGGRPAPEPEAPAGEGSTSPTSSSVRVRRVW